MRKLYTWHLLTEEEIKKLSEKELADYFEWLQTYREEKFQELINKKSLLEKLHKIENEQTADKISRADRQKIQELRTLLHI